MVSMSTHMFLVCQEKNMNDIPIANTVTSGHYDKQKMPPRHQTVPLQMTRPDAACICFIAAGAVHV